MLILFHPWSSAKVFVALEVIIVCVVLCSCHSTKDGLFVRRTISRPFYLIETNEFDIYDMNSVVVILENMQTGIVSKVTKQALEFDDDSQKVPLILGTSGVTLHCTMAGVYLHIEIDGKEVISRKNRQLSQQCILINDNKSMSVYTMPQHTQDAIRNFIASQTVENEQKMQREILTYIQSLSRSNPSVCAGDDCYG